jgi:hypothetical protein
MRLVQGIILEPRNMRPKKIDWHGMLSTKLAEKTLMLRSRQGQTAERESRLLLHRLNLKPMNQKDLLRDQERPARTMVKMCRTLPDHHAQDVRFLGDFRLL